MAMIDILQELLSLDDVVELEMAGVITGVRKPEHSATVVCGVHIDRMLVCAAGIG